MSEPGDPDDSGAVRSPDRPGLAASGRPSPGRPAPGHPGGLVAGATYAVGYAKPPEATRFRKGVSGNPRGRPKGVRKPAAEPPRDRMMALILEEAYRNIPVRDGARTVSVPIAQAVLRALAVNAAKGQHRAQRLFAELLASVESTKKAEHDAFVDAAIQYKIEWERELARRARLGITGAPEPLPHPDHIIIDVRAGTAKVLGPATREEKVEYDRWMGHRADFQAELVELEADLVDEPDPGRIALLEREIADTTKVLGFMTQVLRPIGE